VVNAPPATRSPLPSIPSADDVIARHIPQANASLKAGQWLKNKYTGIEVRNKTIGIIGLGNIGSAVARRAQGMEMKVIAFDPFVSPNAPSS